MNIAKGNKLKAAWHLTANPLPSPDVVEIPAEADKNLRKMTFKLRTGESLRMLQTYRTGEFDIPK